MTRRLLAVALLSVGFVAPVAFAQTNLDDGSAERRRAAEAIRAEIEAARTRVNAATLKVRASWKANPEYLKAEKDAADARAAVEAARKPVLEKLKQTPEYKQALEEESKATTKIEGIKANEDPNAPVQVENARGPAAATLPATTQPEKLDISPERLDAAKKALEKRTATTRLEEAAFKADPEVAKADVNLEAAAAQLTSLQAQLDAALLNDPDFKAAKEALAQAQTRMGTVPAAAGNNGRDYR